jgi:hypothetical protein
MLELASLSRGFTRLVVIDQLDFTDEAGESWGSWGRTTPATPCGALFSPGGGGPSEQGVALIITCKVEPNRNSYMGITPLSMWITPFSGLVLL